MSEAIADGPGVDLSSPRIVHVVGVAGVGMSAIALLLARMGHVVSGSDIKDSTELIRDLDPEDAQKLLDPAIHLMMEAVHRFEGTVNQVLGDGDDS